jgi:hypothetical protein
MKCNLQYSGNRPADRKRYALGDVLAEAFRGGGRTTLMAMAWSRSCNPMIGQ